MPKPPAAKQFNGFATTFFPKNPAPDLSPSRPYAVTDFFRVPSTSSPLAAEIQPPGSKSITNRAMVCAALAQGPSQLNGTLASEDTLVMIQSLRKLGVTIEPGTTDTT
ncbi:MAG: hypothetical protein GY917_21640, partial [Planctomycetaceae bacterium]|nr:hypothetical protein [Planctomycetaceae bacterium]